MSDEDLLVGVLAASPSELPIMRQTGLILEKFDIPHEVRIMSSSRNPDLVDEYARTAFERGLNHGLERIGCHDSLACRHRQNSTMRRAASTQSPISGTTAIRT